MASNQPVPANHSFIYSGQYKGMSEEVKSVLMMPKSLTAHIIGFLAQKISAGQNKVIVIRNDIWYVVISKS